jgi:hypothetical protein
MVFDLAPEILWGGLSVLVLIVANALLGMWAAFVAGEFDVREIPRFLREHVLCDLGPLFILGASSVVHPAMKALYLASVAALDLKYLAKIKDKLAPPAEEE